MKLTELDARFIRREARMEKYERLRAGVDPLKYFKEDFETVEGLREHTIEVATIDEAQGVKFLCPKCFAANGGPVGTHSVVCWSRSRGIPEDVRPGPGRWAMAGSGVHDLTLNADPPGTARSVQLTSGCMWHGHVTDGDAA